MPTHSATSPFSHRVFEPLLPAMMLIAVALSPVAYAEEGISEEVITFTAGDGVRLPALFTYPEDGMNIYGPAILHLHGGPGGSPVRSSSAARYAATGLAQAGYTNLSIETRHATRYAFTQFDEVVEDIRGGIDVLAARGFEDIILAGAGLGSLRMARYMVENEDPRVKAMIHYSPTQNMADNWRQRVGEEEYWDTVDRAARAVEEGGRQPFIDLGDGLIFIPRSFLDWFGPTAKTSLSANIAGIDRPMLMLAGEDDPLVPKGRLEELQAVAFISPRVDVKSYPGVGRLFEGARELVVADSVAWLTDIGLPPAATIETEVLDVTSADGQTVAGVLYTPGSNPQADRPIFVILHGWTNDIMRSVPHWLGVRLAQAGYPAIAIQHRGSGFRGIVRQPLEAITPDLQAWMDEIERRGFNSIIGVGHGAGSLWWSHYLSEVGDTRPDALIYLSPMPDMPQMARDGMGNDLYARAVLDAQEAVNNGQGDSFLVDYPFPRAGYPDDPRQPMFLPPPGSAFTYYYAEPFLSYWGPGSSAQHTRLISEIDLPVLALGGSRDPSMQNAFLLSFTEAAAGDAKYIFYGGPSGASYSFEGFEERVTGDILSWVNGLSDL